MKKDRLESSVLDEVLRDLHAHLPGVFWRQNAGKVQAIHGGWVFLGEPGISDVVGMVSTDAGMLAVFVETKRRKGKQRESQKAWQRMCEAYGAPYVLARSGPQAVDGLKRSLQLLGRALRPLPSIAPGPAG